MNRRRSDRSRTRNPIMAGGSLAMLARKRSSWHIAIIALIAVNTVYQIISIFFGWIVFVDAQHHYHHGPIYFAYLLLCLGIIILMILSILFYSRSFSRQNSLSFGILFTINFLL